MLKTRVDVTKQSGSAISVTGRDLQGLYAYSGYGLRNGIERLDAFNGLLDQPLADSTGEQDDGHDR